MFGRHFVSPFVFIVPSIFQPSLWQCGELVRYKFCWDQEHIFHLTHNTEVVFVFILFRFNFYTTSLVLFTRKSIISACYNIRLLLDNILSQ